MVEKQKQEIKKLKSELNPIQNVIPIQEDEMIQEYDDEESEQLS
jgi:hypothetical protein